MKDLKLKPRNYKHGACARNEKLYNTWATMIHRCEDKKRIKFPAMAVEE